MTNHDDVLLAGPGPPDETTVLGIARKLVYGDRQADYGHPVDNWSDIAKMISIYLGHPVTSRQAALIMVIIKVCRDKRRTRDDNLIDIAGYAEVAGRIAKFERDVKKTQLASSRAELGGQPDFSAVCGAVENALNPVRRIHVRKSATDRKTRKGPGKPVDRKRRSGL